MTDRPEFLDQLRKQLHTAAPTAARRRNTRRLAGAVAATALLVTAGLITWRIARDHDTHDDTTTTATDPETGGSETPIHVTPTTPGTPSPQPTPTQEPASVVTLSEECPPDNGQLDLSGVEFGFAGTVTDVSRGLGEMLVTFDVDVWFSVEWDPRFTVRMQSSPAIGDYLAVGGDAHRGQRDAGGTVEVCSDARTSDALPSWHATFDRQLTDQDLAVAAALESDKATWEQNEPAAYSYVVQYWTAASCPVGNGGVGNGSLRVVVVDGAPAQAVSTYSGCEPQLDEVPSISDLFDLAIASVGAEEFLAESHPDTDQGLVLHFSASGRSFSASARVVVSTDATYAVNGWDAVGVAYREARARWEQAPFDHRVTINSIETWFRTTVIGGEVVTVIDRDGLTVDITQLSRPWDAAVVEDVFEILDEREPTGHVVAVFDPATGAPTELWLDPYPTAIDDEEQYTLTVERL